MSAAAAKLLIARAKSSEPPERPVDMLLPFELIHRASTAPPPK